MGTFRLIPKEIKEQIISRIKNDGISVSQTAKDHAVSTKTIYNWLRLGISKDPSILEVNRLKKQNRDLAELVDRITLELTKFKKRGFS